MDSLIFQTSPIYWIGDWYTSLIIAIIVASSILGYILIRSRHPKDNQQMQIIPYAPIDPIHPYYIDKTLQSLREYLERIYFPRHTTAHTAEELQLYIQDSELSSIIRELEEYEYQGIILDTEKKRTYNERIEKSLPTTL